MIDQGTDDLSRGLWIAPYSRISTNITMHLFGPSSPSPLLLEWAVRQVGSSVPPSEWIWQADLARCSPSQLMHQHVIWTLTPTLARQAFSTAPMEWVEAPWYSSHICLVPRLVQRDVGRVNKNNLIMGYFWQLPLPADFQPLIPLIPFVIFYLAPLIRSIPNPSSHDMDEPTSVPYP
jgi:hypothetical protein